MRERFGNSLTRVLPRPSSGETRHHQARWRAPSAGGDAANKYTTAAVATVVRIGDGSTSTSICPWRSTRVPATNAACASRLVVLRAPRRPDVTRAIVGSASCRSNCSSAALKTFALCSCARYRRPFCRSITRSSSREMPLMVPSAGACAYACARPRVPPEKPPRPRFTSALSYLATSERRDCSRSCSCPAMGAASGLAQRRRSTRMRPRSKPSSTETPMSTGQSPLAPSSSSARKRGSVRARKESQAQRSGCA
mmetsp:Transcript_57709/g.132499  ORF Transcript_57709/g.132499 Transcript_57709/m.132499 type:complete len:253 (-) Transcript_57709:282-1040(-)